MLAYHPTPAAGPGEPPPERTVWIDLFNASEAEIRLVQDHTGLTLPTREQLAEIEASSRLAFRDGVLRLSSPVVANADGDQAELSYVGLILTPKLFVTVRFDALHAFEHTATLACTGDAPTSSALVFTTLMEGFADRQADLLETARAQLDAVSHAVFRSSATNPARAMRSNTAMRAKLQTIGRIGERISIVRESMLAIARAIPFALDSGQGWFDADLARRLAGVRTDIDSLGTFEEHLSNKVQFLLDAVIGFIGIEQNDVFKVLTIASVVGIFPTLVAGWYGMNFQHMPEYTWTYGYQYGIGAIVLSAVIPLAWFKWRGWM